MKSLNLLAAALLLLPAAALADSPSSAAPAPAASAAPAPQRKPFDLSAPAETQYKNIKYFTGATTAAEVNDAMHYMEAALGTGCGGCHVRGGFEKEDKQEKETARKMLAMTARINQEHFGGKPEITCMTCHQGRMHPLSLPLLTESQPGSWSLPPVEIKKGEGTTLAKLWEKWTAAMGGAKGLAKAATRSASVEQVWGPDSPPMPIEILGRGEDAFRVTMTFEHDGEKSTSTYVSDGKTSFRIGEDGSRGPLAEADRDGILRSALLVPVLDPAGFKDAQEVRKSKIGDKLAWVVDAIGRSGLRERIWFDADSGLIVRREWRTKTILGQLPHRMDYLDYETESGVPVPRRIVETSAGGEATTMRVTKLELGGKLPEGAFSEAGK